MTPQSDPPLDPPLDLPVDPPLDPPPDRPLAPLLEWLPDAQAPEQLVVLLHGWRGRAADMVPLAERLRATFARAAVLAPDAPHPGDAQDGRPRGRQWYSIEGLVDAAGDPLRAAEAAARWRERVDAARAPLQHWLRAQQQRLGVGAAATAIGGFSQGAVIALRIALAEDGLAGRVLAFGGSLCAPLETAPELTTLHLLHGASDDVFPAARARQAFEAIGALQGDATLDIASGVGHELHPALIDCAIHRLTHHIPMRTWRAALGAAPARAPPR